MKRRLHLMFAKGQDKTVHSAYSGINTLSADSDIVATCALIDDLTQNDLIRARKIDITELDIS